MKWGKGKKLQSMAFTCSAWEMDSQTHLEGYSLKPQYTEFVTEL